MRLSVFLLAAALAAVALAAGPARAQDGPAAPADAIAVGQAAPSDALVAERIAEVFAQLPELAGVEVTVEAGVAHLTGAAATGAAIDRAEAIAARVDGVAAVRNDIERDLEVSSRVAPTVETVEARVRSAAQAAPLYLTALAVLVAAFVLAWLLKRWAGLWRRITPNPFVAELAAGIAWLSLVMLGVVLALMVLDATALLTAALGAAGVLGLAVGFAVRDVIENYLASVLLSLRQPFRPNDHVVINGHEGRVARLTSRATILLTIEGNHLRIPNAEVFKATILNYTRNPERRFDFKLGVAAEDDPLAAIALAREVLGGMDFVLDEPSPGGRICEVGDSNIVIEFWAWIDQRGADFVRSRSAALAAVKAALESGGFALPEPIYRLRWDGGPPAPGAGGAEAAPAPEAPAPTTPASRRPIAEAAAAAGGTAPDPMMDRLVEEERRESGEEDLLNEAQPTE